MSDATGHTVQVSEDIIIVEKNSAPVAYSQAVVTDKNTSKAITLGGSDAEDDPLTYTVVSGPDHGNLNGSAPNLTYTPATGYTGSDSFSFIVNDGKSDSAQATVSIIVRDGDIVWKLIRTEIMPVIGSYQTSWTSSNGYFTFNSMGQVSEG